MYCRFVLFSFLIYFCVVVRFNSHNRLDNEKNKTKEENNIHVTVRNATAANCGNNTHNKLEE